MRTFGIRLMPFIIGAALFWLLGWYQANFHAPEGDLVRTSFLITNRQYPDPEPLPEVHDSTLQDILLVGDSHLGPTPSSRRFQNHLEITVSSHSHWSYASHSNPFSLGVAIAHEEAPRLVVFEVVERNLIHFANSFLQQDSIHQPRIKNTPIKKHDRRFRHLGNGVRTAAAFLNLRLKWFQNDQCRILPCTVVCPLLSENSIWITKMVWQRRKPKKEVMPILSQLNEAISAQLRPQGTDFLIYVIPDKATVYSDFFDSSDLHPSFLVENALPSRIHSPVVPMREAVSAGTMEVYKYSDTHLATAGAEIVGAHLNGILQRWLDHHSNTQ